MQVEVGIPQGGGDGGDDADAAALLDRLFHHRAVGGHHRNIHQVAGRFHHRGVNRAGQPDGVGAVLLAVSDKLAHPAAQLGRNLSLEVNKKALVQQVNYLGLGEHFLKGNPNFSIDWQRLVAGWGDSPGLSYLDCRLSRRSCAGRNPGSQGLRFLPAQERRKYDCASNAIALGDFKVIVKLLFVR